MAHNNVMLIPLKAIVTLYHYHNHRFINPKKAWTGKKIQQNINETQCNQTSIQSKQKTSVNKIYVNKSNGINSITCTSRLLSISSNEYYENTLDFIDANILYETIDNEVVTNDLVQKTTMDNDNFELSEEFDNYIIVEDITTEDTLHNDNYFIQTI